MKFKREKVEMCQSARDLFTISSFCCSTRAEDSNRQQAEGQAWRWVQRQTHRVRPLNCPRSQSDHVEQVGQVQLVGLLRAADSGEKTSVILRDVKIWRIFLVIFEMDQSRYLVASRLFFIFYFGVNVWK